MLLWKFVTSTWCVYESCLSCNIYNFKINALMCIHTCNKTCWQRQAGKFRSHQWYVVEDGLLSVGPITNLDNIGGTDSLQYHTTFTLLTVLKKLDNTVPECSLILVLLWHLIHVLQKCRFKRAEVCVSSHSGEESSRGRKITCFKVLKLDLGIQR